MAKTLNHYSQQIRALAPDALALDRARELGNLLIEAKAAVTAAGRKWGEWLDSDCSLAARTALRFMAIAKRWEEPAFTEARQARPDLPLREADKVLAASSTRKRPEPATESEHYGQSTLARAQFDLQLLCEWPGLPAEARAPLAEAREHLEQAARVIHAARAHELLRAVAALS